MSAKPARNHHYLPQFILRGFATDGLVHAYDRNDEVWRRVPPRSVGFEKDLYTVDLPGQSPDRAETGAMSPLDRRISITVNRVRQDEPLPPDAAHVCRALVSTLAARHPRMQVAFGRDTIELGYDALEELIEAAQDDDRWKAALAAWGELGVDVDVLRENRELLKTTTVADWDFPTMHTQVVQMQLGLLQTLTTPGAMSEFAVLLVVIPDGRSDRFILADAPAVYIQDPDRPARSGEYPSIDGAHALFVPIGPQQAVILDHRATSPDESVRHLDPDELARVTPSEAMVRGLNAAAFKGADRFVFAASPELYLPPGA